MRVIGRWKIEGHGHPLIFITRRMLATHILTHTFQHTLFDWLKVTWVPPNHVGLI